MDFISHFYQFIKPSRVHCNQHHPATNSNEFGQNHNEQVSPGSQENERVPSFQQFYLPVLHIINNQQIIKGFKFSVAFPLSPYFQVVSTWEFPNQGTTGNDEEPDIAMPFRRPAPKFSLSATVFQDVKIKQPETILMGKVESQGKINALFFKKLSQSISLKFTGSFESSNIQQGVTSLDIEKSGKNYRSLLRFGNKIFQFNYMQKINRQLFIGIDYLTLPQKKLSYISYGAKLLLKNHSIFTRYSEPSDEFSLEYMIPIKKGTQFVSSFKYNVQEEKTRTKIGLKQSFSQSCIITTVDTLGQISTIINFRTSNLLLKLCALINYPKDRYSFGYGISLGQSF